MKTAILYGTRYGTAAFCAEQIASKLQGTTAIINLKKEKKPDISDYDSFIIGGSIYSGKIIPSVQRFIEAKHDELLQKRVALYICCLYEGEKAVEEMENNFPGWLLAHAAWRYCLGGRIQLSTLKKIDKFLIRNTAGVTEDIERISAAKIEQLVANLNALS